MLVADVFRPNDDKQHPVLLAAGPYGKGLPFSVGYPHQWHELTTNHTDALAGSSNKYRVWEYPDDNDDYRQPGDLLLALVLKT